MTENNVTDHKELKGLDGWLFILGTGLCFTSVRMIWNSIDSLSVFVNGTWDTLTSVDSSMYIPGWETLFIGQFVVSTALILMSFFMIYLFFTKSYRFPIYYVGFLLFVLILIPIEAYFTTTLFEDKRFILIPFMFNFLWQFGYAAIGIPYMLKSKRVQLTFVEHRPTAAKASISTPTSN